MRIVTVQKLLEVAKQHPGSEKRVHAFLQLVRNQVWQVPADVKAFDCKTSFVGKLVVFDMGSDRLVVKIRYASAPRQTSRPIYFQHLFSPDEYDKWSRDQRRHLCFGPENDPCIGHFFLGGFRFSPNKELRLREIREFMSRTKSGRQGSPYVSKIWAWFDSQTDSYNAMLQWKQSERLTRPPGW